MNYVELTDGTIVCLDDILYIENELEGYFINWKHTKEKFQISKNDYIGFKNIFKTIGNSYVCL